MQRLTLLILAIACYGIGAAQQGVGIGTTTPDNSAILHLESSSKGLLLPRMSNTARLNILSPAEGLMVYDSTEAVVYQFRNNGWQQIGSGGGGLWSTYADGIEYGDDRVAIRSGMNHRIIFDPAYTVHGPGIELFDNDSIRAFDLITTSFGSELRMYNEAGTQTLQLAARHNDGVLFGGGALSLWDDLQERRVKLVASQENDQALLHLYNPDGQPSVKLETDMDTTGAGGLSLHNAQGLERIEMYAGFDSERAYMRMYNEAEVPTISFDADYMATGKGRVTTDEIEIRGGADLAEMFNVTGDSYITPGSVVCVDPENEGALVLSGRARDRTVVGVISGANGVDPGLLMGHQGTEAFGEYPVAIAGRVYVRANDIGGQIRPGDFLTTSPVPGEAMCVEDFDAARGAILGKALTSRDSRTGYVLILVHLQ